MTYSARHDYEISDGHAGTFEESRFCGDLCPCHRFDEAEWEDRYYAGRTPEMADAGYHLPTRTPECDWNLCDCPAIAPFGWEHVLAVGAAIGVAVCVVGALEVAGWLR